MKIILTCDIEKLGKKLEIKNVKPGYARNFLIPRKMAIPSTKGNLKWREKKLEAINKKEEKLKEDIKKTVEQIKQTELQFLAKTGEKNELFEKITEDKILKILKEKGIEIKKESIKLKEPIKKIGEYEVIVNLNKDTKTKIKIIVKSELNT